MLGSCVNIATGTANDIFIVGYYANGIDHDKNLRNVMRICGQENLKIDKNKCHLSCTGIAILPKHNKLLEEILPSNCRGM